MSVSQNEGYPFGGPQNKDYSILGSILGSLVLGNYEVELTQHGHLVKGRVSLIVTYLSNL